MCKWLLLALALVIASFAISCKSTPKASTPPSSPTVATTQAAAPGGGDSCSGGSCAGEVAGQSGTVNLSLQLPAAALTAEPAGPSPDGLPRRGSPYTHVSEALGVTLISKQGCVIGEVATGGPAERGGLKPGDSIVKCNGGDVECPSTLDAWLYAGKKPGLVELTVKRAAGSGEACSGASCAVESKTPAAAKPGGKS